MKVYACTANEAFLNVASSLMDKEDTDIYQSSPRGLKTRELLNVNIEIENPYKYTTVRSRFPYVIGELCWYLNAKNTIDDIKEYAPFWETITNSDGTINSNYGIYLFEEQQLLTTGELLLQDPDTRKAVVSIFQKDTVFSKDTTCTISIQYFTRKRNEYYELHQIVTMRSNDICKGFSTDVCMFSIFQQILLHALNVKSDNNFANSGKKLQLGKYWHNAGSMHVYEDDFDQLQKYADRYDQEGDWEIEQLPEFSLEAFYEIEDALIMESEIRKEKRLPIVPYEFKSEFWQKAQQVLIKKFIK